jgi:thioredoxin 1
MTLLSRRSLLVAGALGLALTLSAPAALALSVTTYTPDTLAAAQASGKPFLIDFYATWCTTCRAQERVIEGLMEENPEYRAIPVIRVDWDEHERGDLVRDMQIPRRSTLVVMQGTAELGRLVAGTGKDQIRALLDLAI